MIGRTGRRYRGNSEPFDTRSAPPRGRGVIQVPSRTTRCYSVGRHPDGGGRSLPGNERGARNQTISLKDNKHGMSDVNRKQRQGPIRELGVTKTSLKNVQRTPEM